MAALHLATRVFLAGNHVGDEQRDQEREIEEKRKNMREVATISLQVMFSFLI